MVGVFKMVEQNKVDENLSSISKKINEVYAESKEKEQHAKKDVVLFFSFDVVNSTSYKTVNYFGWAQVLNLIFKELRGEVLNKIKGAEMWRVLGDEAIFIVKIRDEDELREYVNKIFRIMILMIYKIKKGEFFKKDSVNYELLRLQNILSLKSSCWIADVTDVGDVSKDDILQKDADNIFERYESQEGYEIFEFLGNDIDTGFRVATQTQDGCMALSFELAYLISLKTESLSYLHIITYKKLKGVWKEKLYPIIWYHDPKAYLDLYQKEIQFDENFAFDAYGESELIREYYDNHDPKNVGEVIRDKRMYVDPFYAFSKIIQDRGLSDKIERLQQVIKEAVIDSTKYIDMESMQVHCVAVCFKIDDNGEIKILVAKRRENRKKFAGQWEFGCAKAVLNKTIEQKIKEEYKEDFNVDIAPVLDTTRNIQEPIPIALYQVEHSSDGEKKDKGIIMLAQIKGEFLIDEFKQTDKHEKVKWIEEKDLKNIDRDYKQTIPDFKQTLETAFEKIKDLQQEGDI